MGVQGSFVLNLDAFVFFSVSCTSSEKQTMLNLFFPVDTLIKVMECCSAVFQCWSLTLSDILQPWLY